MPEQGKRGDGRAVVVQREALGGEHVRLRLRPAGPFAAEPGQFVMVRVSEGIDPLLRRPLSIHRVAGEESGEFEILFRVVGTGTRLLARMQVGDRIDVLGPLGKPFRLQPGAAVLVGGGIGVAPLLFLAEALLRRGSPTRLLLGGRRERDILCHGDFSCLSVPCSFVTEDGSLGEAGLVTQLLGRELERAGSAAAVYACGPVPMLAAVARICRERGVSCQVSLEAHMACGMGACLGCVVRGAHAAYLRVCKEGPVFDAEEIDWSEGGPK